MIDALAGLGPLALLGIALAGYLAGSISFARVLGRGVDFAGTEMVVDGGEAAADDAVRLTGASPGMLRAHRGSGRGGLAAILDVTKALVAVLVVDRLLGPEAAAIAGLGTVVGHVAPVWHHFRGGFGVSPIVGSLLVLDPAALGIALVVGGVLGVLAGSPWLATAAWPVLLVGVAGALRPAPTLVLAAGAGLLYGVRMWPSAVVAWRAHRGDGRPWRVRVREIGRPYPYLRPVEGPTAGPVG